MERMSRIVHRPVVLLALLPLLLITLTACDAGVAGSGERVRLVITPADTPTATPLAAPTMAPTTYVVKAGDTLSGIADLFGVSVDDIVRASNIADPNMLSEGQVLTIPLRPPEGTAAVTPSAPVEGTGTPGTPAPQTSPTLPPPDVTPPLGPDVAEPTPGDGSVPGSTISPTAEP